MSLYPQVKAEEPVATLARTFEIGSENWIRRNLFSHYPVSSTTKFEGQMEGQSDPLWVQQLWINVICLLLG